MSVCECVPVCVSVRECSQMCASVRECARVCTSVRECVFILGAQGDFNYTNSYKLYAKPPAPMAFKNNIWLSLGAQGDYNNTNIYKCTV